MIPNEWNKIRNPLLAIILSFFFTGWGQWYNGKTWDGLKIFGAFLVFYLPIIILSTMTSDQPFASIFVVILFVASIGVWIYGMFDSYKTAEGINRNKENFFRKSRLFWFPMFFFILLIFAVIASFIFGMAGSDTYQPLPNTSFVFPIQPTPSITIQPNHPQSPPTIIPYHPQPISPVQPVPIVIPNQPQPIPTYHPQIIPMTLPPTIVPYNPPSIPVQPHHPLPQPPRRF